AREREPHPDAAAARPRRPVPPVGVPAGHRVGQAAVRGRRGPRRSAARRQQGLEHGRRDGDLRAGGRDRHGVVRARV
ncbi:MAG: Dihydrofolate reductase, partial [uncultured Thermoleophilia bacterium]